MKYFLFGWALLLAGVTRAQTNYWQQHADYTMDIDFDVQKHQYKGEQKLVYTNNSPDTLDRVFYHLYFNAFQPGSMMDVRSRTIEDPDRRVGSRIAALSEDEVGYLKVDKLTQDKKAVKFAHVGTILEVTLNEPILPGKSTTLKMEFNGQVPLQIRRSGRDNKEGISYSMSQWYPKLSEYDIEGWHANPYIGREFHGVWGSFEVTIHIDKAYMVAATGYLQNADEIGMGYEDEGDKVKQKIKDGKLTWNFKAPNVHDFVWAADPDYLHDRMKVNDELEIHFFYEDEDEIKPNWKALQESTKRLFEIMNENFGQYPYKSYSIIQGGDGGMEYPMATLITGERSLNSLVGVTIHEVNHSWYQMMLATNEAKYAWMDEGFTTYASNYVEDVLADREPGTSQTQAYRSYFALVNSGKEEPLTTHADHFKTNFAYSIASYVKGSMVPHLMSYVMGQDKMMEGMRRYFHEWKFKHPTFRNYKRVMEKTSDMELDWFFEHWVNSTNTIDYGISAVVSDGEKTAVTLENVGTMPMPNEVVVTFEDGSEVIHYIPLRIMRGQKSFEGEERAVVVEEDWPWTYPTYRLEIDRPMSEITKIEVDPSQRMADLDRSNNVFPTPSNTEFNGK